MNALREWITSIVLEALRELPDDNVWQYAAKHFFLGGNQSLTPRFFDPWLTPATRIFQEAALGQWTFIHPEDWWLRALVEKGQRVDEFFCVKSSQSGFTQAALNIITYITRFLSGRGLYCIDSREKAGKLCRLRLLPLLKQECKGQISDNETDLGAYWLELANWVWEMVGSYSAGVFSEKPLTHAFLDDVEYMVTEGGKRGFLDGVHIIDHARSRFTTADQSFLAVFSKPDVEESHFISEWKGGSQHAFHVPCPFCNFGQVLEIRSLQYNKPECRDAHGRYDLEAVEALTTVRCEKCEKEIEERWKADMAKAGYYLPKSQEERLKDGDPLLSPRRMSVRVNDLVSPFAGVTWGKLARMRIEAENNPAKLKFLYTNHGAVPWREKAISLKASQVRALIAGRRPKGLNYIHGEKQGVTKPYKRGECPFLPVAVTATSDRQGDKLKWTACGWTLEGACALIEYGATISEKDLHALNDQPLNHAGFPYVCLVKPDLHLFAGLGLEHGGCLIDSGFETFEVYDFCAASGWRWYPSKGVPTVTGTLVEGKRDWKDGREILRYNYNDFALKTHFYNGKIALHTHPAPDKRKPSDLLLPADVGDEFIVELISESLVPKKLSTGQTVMVWHHDAKIGPNDWGDAMKKQYALWQIILPYLQQRDQLRRIEVEETLEKAPELPQQLLAAWQYCRNTSTPPTIEQFDEDHEPIGPRLRSHLGEMGVLLEGKGRVYAV